MLGGLIGNQIGSAHGVGGLGMVGTGVGGGGTGEGTIGLGNLGTIGKGGGDASTGNGSGYGRGAGGLGGRRARAPDVLPGVPNVRGQLDKEIVRRIIRRHINEVKSCYEQELTKHPELGGRDHGAVHHRRVGPGHRVGPPEFDAGQRACRELHCPGRPSLGVPVADRRRHRHRVVSLRADAQGRRERGTRHRSRSARRDRGRPIVQALATLTESADAAHIERISSLLGLRRVSGAEALAWTINRRGADFDTHLLVARLLERSKRHRDAVRVLTESMPGGLAAITAELEQTGADSDAAELRRLGKR